METPLVMSEPGTDNLPRQPAQPSKRASSDTQRKGQGGTVVGESGRGSAQRLKNKRPSHEEIDGARGLQNAGHRACQTIC